MLIKTSLRPALILGAMSTLLLVMEPANVEAQRAPQVEVRRRGPVVHQRHVEVRPEPRSQRVTRRVQVQPQPHHVVVRTAPPPPRRSAQRRRAPRYDAVWVEGHWAWNGARYVWTEGRWERQRREHVWVQPAWQPDGNGGYYFVEGHWAPDPAIGQPTPHYPAPPPPSYPPAQSANVVSACSSATIGDAALQQCIRLAQPLGAYAAQAVTACGAEVVGNGGLEQCLRAIQSTGPTTSNVIHACGAATIGNGGVEQCVRVATRARMDPTYAIQSCSQATIGEGAFLQCLQSSVR